MANETQLTSPATPSDAEVASRCRSALEVVDDVILKNYMTALPEMEVVPLKRVLNIDDVRIFKITEMVYEKDEFATYKFASAFNALSFVDASIFLILDSDGVKTDFYMGIRSLGHGAATELGQILEGAMKGQFPGMKTSPCYKDDIEKILNGIREDCISTVSCVANSKQEDLHTNQEFVQGLEKFVLSMQGQKYTGIILANSASQQQLKELRKIYEDIYTQLSPLASRQMNYSNNASVQEGESQSVSLSESLSKSSGTQWTRGTSTSHGTSKENTTAKVIKGLGAASSILGSALSILFSETENEGTAESESKGGNESTMVQHGKSKTNTISTSVTRGTSSAITLTEHDKFIENILSRIDKQLERMNEFESTGLYECAAYFLSDTRHTTEIAASIYKGIMRGEKSGVEVAAINTWGKDKKKNAGLIAQYVKNLMHPVFKYHIQREDSNIIDAIEVSPSSMVSGNELAIHMGLPRRSVCGLPVIEHADFGKEVTRYENANIASGIRLGEVFNMGSSCSGNKVILDKESLSMHTFVTGSTGSGKSNTIYELIRQASFLNAHFMVIEPAKGEYKHVFGNRPDVRVYGTNPAYSALLRINPFKFPKGIHVLEHVDRLVEIFNVCWPMYAAMPAVLKDALLQAYEACGWDFSTSRNAYGENMFPTFADLQNEMVSVIQESAYSEEVKGNYMGSLVTRVKSLTNGLNGQIFCSDEIDNEKLFDENVIVDLSRVGSLETKSLIMGILVMRLSEHRMSSAEDMNLPLRHLTILEEAHNLLKRTSTEQSPEGANVAGKSVEMISNAIAEMRTYGEGFVIVDQSPNAVDISAIRNTNTKIIMRLPDEADRRLAGKSAGLRDEQLDEIAKLPKGVAVVYQNDWVEPVLCKINEFKGSGGRYEYQPAIHLDRSTGKLRRELLQLLLRSRVQNPIDSDIDDISRLLEKADIPGRYKMGFFKILREYEIRHDLALWREDNFDSLSRAVTALFDGDAWIGQMMASAGDYDELTESVTSRIENMAPGIQAEYALGAAQCLLKAKSEESGESYSIYSSWVNDLIGKHKKIM